jgi:hypothetical protein
VVSGQVKSYGIVRGKVQVGIVLCHRTDARGQAQAAAEALRGDADELSLYVQAGRYTVFQESVPVSGTASHCFRSHPRSAL